MVLLSILSTHAQIVFCPAGAVWKSIHTRSWPDQTLETETVVYTGTQVVNGETVKVLTHFRFFLDINYGDPSPTYLKQNGDTVFFKNGFTQSNWQILYNFAAQPGDSWYNSFSGSGSGSRSYTISVVSVQTVSVLGQTLKQLSVHQHHTGGPRNNFDYFITERLGSNMFVFTFGGMSASDGDNWRENLCYTDDTFGTFRYSTKSCDYTILLGVNEAGNVNSDFDLFPNPAAESIQLKNENANSSYHYAIYSALGQKVQEGETDLSSETAEIKVQDLSPGIYFLSLKTEGNKEIVKRFLKIN